ncbi:serine hydrolase domain-containing protein [Chryseobacterium phocaeense]|uniref:serine hydrolase domain-containing protein n=1 Tax=Chryseobacterium phocaeense TaxID=1816690 RepID=UPI0013EF485A|nr:serine hydrolase domain-containing protein [Chryseobacterium phocaeense]
MDKFLRQQMDSLKLPGLSIAFINEGKIVYTNEFGFSDIETQTKVKPNTLFEAASMSKTVFAYFVLKLVDKGLLDLDTPLFQYLKNNDLAYDDRYKLITARMVLSHTTGMPNWREWDPADPELHIKKGDLYLKFMPGTAFSYSGEAYQYLMNVVAHLMNKTPQELDQVFYNEVCKPLKMKHAYYWWNDYIKKHRAAGYKQKDGVNEKQPVKKFEEFGAAGTLRINAVDYARFMIGLMNEEGLSKKSAHEMFKVQSKVPDWDDADYWGLGIGMKSTAYGMRYMHSGNNGDFTAYFIMYKDKKSGFVFLTNCNRAGDLFEKLEPYFSNGTL